MESQPQNLEFRNNPENFHPCHRYLKCMGQPAHFVCFQSSRDRSSWVEAVLSMDLYVPY